MHHNGFSKIFTNHDWYKLVKTDALFYNGKTLAIGTMDGVVRVVFIIKVTVKDNSFKWNLQRDKLVQCWFFSISILDLRWCIIT